MEFLNIDMAKRAKKTNKFAQNQRYFRAQIGIKKRGYLFSLVLVLVFTLLGCGSKSGNASTDIEKESNILSDTSAQKDNPSSVKKSKNAIKDEKASSDDIKEDRSLSGMEKYLLEQGCLTGEKIDKSFDLIGAIDGFGYDCGIEIYEYDISSDIYSSIVADKEIQIEELGGFSIHFSAINGEFALVFSNEDENFSQSIIDTFMKY